MSSIVVLILTIIWLSLDQLSKRYIIQNFSLHQQKEGLKGIFNLYYVQNEGAGWGLFQGQQTLFIIVTLVVVSYLCYLTYKHPKAPLIYKVAYSLLIAGSLGNFIDRLRFGYVIDMIQLTFIKFPIFNVADMAITFGVIIILILLFTDEKGLDYL